MQIDGQPGLIAVLTGRATDEEAIHKADGAQLWVLPAGAPRPDGADADLLAGESIGACLQRWQTERDLILLDSTAVGPVADTRILSRHADAAILVARQGQCRRGQLLEDLRTKLAPVLLSSEIRVCEGLARQSKREFYGYRGLRTPSRSRSPGADSRFWLCPATNRTQSHAGLQGACKLPAGRHSRYQVT